MLVDVDAFVRLEKVSVDIFEDLGKNVVWQGHCVFQLSKLEAIRASGRTSKNASITGTYSSGTKESYVWS